ncbi:MAG: hypothetical protein IPO62_11935 [Saprospiraceae bacterium]|nr:hypothetical protein [Saprospiraceae bacterium]MBK9631758.1 hypothetical protein [Saprospiraceae bacterium]
MEIKYKDGLRIENYSFNSINRYSIAFDSADHIYFIRNYINDSICEELNFEFKGRLFSKLIYNKLGMLHGNAYWYYPSGSVKSMRRYYQNKYYSRGIDYYDSTEIVLRNIFYDSTGTYYYRIDFSDTSTYYEEYFNHNNPLSYLMIMKDAPEPTRSRLMKLIESIGLDSLKQIH